MKRLILVSCLAVTLVAAWWFARERGSEKVERAHENLASSRAVSPSSLADEDASLVVPQTDVERAATVDEPAKEPEASAQVAPDQTPFYLIVFEPWIQARVIGVDGVAVARARCSISWHEDEAPRTSSADGALETDAEGRVRMAVPACRDPSARRFVKIDVDRGLPTARTSRLIELPRELPVDTTDIGDCIVAAEPVLVEGTVTDASGREIAGATVYLDGAHLARQGALRPRYTTGFQGTTDARGRFRICGELASTGPGGEPSLDVRAIADDYAGSEPVECSLGARNVHITLLGGGELVGRVEIDERLDPLTVQVSVHGADLSTFRFAVNEEIVSAESGLEFSVPRLSAGTYDLSVTTGTGQLLAVIEGISVRNGERTDDARLLPIRIAYRARVDFEIVGPDDAPVNGAQVMWLVRANGTFQSARGHSGSKSSSYTYLTEPEGAVAVVSHPRFQSERIDDPIGKVRVKLRPAPRIGLLFVGSSDGVGKDMVRLRLTPKNPWPDLGWSFARPLDWDPTVEQPTPSWVPPGLYDIAWYRTGLDHPPQEWTDPTFSSVTIADVSEVQTIRVPVPADLLARLDAAK